MVRGSNSHRWALGMPKGPRGEKQPGVVIGAAVKVMRITTGEETEEVAVKSAAAELGSRGGGASGCARVVLPRARCLVSAYLSAWTS
jgi:hypothetical protein